MPKLVIDTKNPTEGNRDRYAAALSMMMNDREKLNWRKKFFGDNRLLGVTDADITKNEKAIQTLQQMIADTVGDK